MNIIDIEISKIQEYENNPRNNENAVDAVAESIKQFGFKSPIIIDKDYIIVAGHTRLKAARKLNLSSVPCLIADDLTKEQIKAFRLADNKTGELAEWDFSKLEKELALIEIDMEKFGFDMEDFTEEIEVVEDDVPEVKEETEPVTKQGDIWQLGRHRLICGDATDSETVSLLMDGAAADLFVTDPPYNVSYEGGTSEKLTIQNDSMPDDEFVMFLQSAFENANENMRDGAGFYIWHSESEGYNFRTAVKFIGWEIRQCLIWTKNSIVLGRQDYQWKHEPCLYGWKSGAAHYFTDDRTQSTILEYNKPNRSAEHPTMKPVELIAKTVSNSSRKGDIVLDLFGGSGTTLIACEQLDRVCYMSELDPKYCDVIIKRWETLTGEKAIKIMCQNETFS